MAGYTFEACVVHASENIFGRWGEICSPDNRSVHCTIASLRATPVDEAVLKFASELLLNSTEHFAL
jgi:hypothetical protein